MTLLNGKKGDIEVLQLMRVLNSGDVPYTGEALESPTGEPLKTRAVIRLPVPEGAFDIAPSDAANPQAMAEGPGGIFTTVPLPPGETLVSYIYRVRPARSGWALRRQVEYPTRSINLLVGPGLTLESGGFDLKERKNLGGVDYRRYRAGPFGAGSVLSADVGFGAQNSKGLWAPFATAGAATLVLGMGLAFFIRRRAAGRGPRSDQTHLAPGDLDPAGRAAPVVRDDLIVEIARLDEQFESGAIGEASYLSRRKELKERLALLTPGTGS